MNIMEAMTTSAEPSGSLAAPTLPWLGLLGWSDFQLEAEGSDHLEDLSGIVVSSQLQQRVPLDPFLNQQGSPQEWADTAVKGLGNWDSFQNHTDPSQELHLFVENDMLGDSQREHSSIEMDQVLATDPKDHNAGIAQLTQLSTRLYPLHNSSHTLAEIARQPSSSRASRASSPQKENLTVDKAVFQNIMTRLLQGWSDKSSATQISNTPGSSSLCDILQETLSASYTLLEIMDCLQAKPQASSASGLSPLTPITTPNSQAEQDNTRSPNGSQSSNTVVRHLVMACHGMLLSIYTAVLGVLQREADKSTSSGRNVGLNAIGCEEAGPLNDMPLVMIVELCSYLIRRQQQAVDSYFRRDECFSGAVGSLPDPSQASPPNDLEVKMRQGLARLRQTLRI
ncbi:hypothetical protein N0V90_013510 [Kalmusia sp. IMI 367209]|nr:hypothetical protein N0V90_013510 [Kalmusia sp. IMI 367209]